jgi:hypothetical protein
MIGPLCLNFFIDKIYWGGIRCQQNRTNQQGDPKTHFFQPLSNFKQLAANLFQTAKETGCWHSRMRYRNSGSEYMFDRERLKQYGTLEHRLACQN